MVDTLLEREFRELNF